MRDGLFCCFNPSKCQVLHITKSRHPAQHIYTLRGQALEAAGHAKFLGVDIGKDLRCNIHLFIPEYTYQ